MLQPSFYGEKSTQGYGASMGSANLLVEVVSYLQYVLDQIDLKVQWFGQSEPRNSMILLRLEAQGTLQERWKQYNTDLLFHFQKI